MGRDGILVLIGSEAELVAHLFGRWFDRVENVAEFWVERSGKPVRHVRLYRCTNQRLAFPFGPDRAERITSR